MQIYTSFEEFKGAKNPVVTTGTFDGVHFGHRKIITRMREIARAIHGETLIISFFPHPRMILHPEDQNLKLLNSIPEKVRLLEDLGIDHFLLIPFSRDFSNMSSDDFVQKILVDTLHTSKLVIGYDHRFGKDRKGDFNSLIQMGNKLGFSVEEIPEQDIDAVAVSSTKIRQSLATGHIKTANVYLGYPYSLEGRVVKGDQIGRTLGYPTANIQMDDTNKLIPIHGIYATKIYLEGYPPRQEPYIGMLYIGNRPALNKTIRSIEVNIFDFKEDIYGNRIRVELLEFIREDANFTSLEALISQMSADKVQTLQYFTTQNFNFEDS
jgi:riboflavin kinase / FMN adenylyltransferase